MNKDNRLERMQNICDAHSSVVRVRRLARATVENSREKEKGWPKENGKKNIDFDGNRSFSLFKIGIVSCWEWLWVLIHDCFCVYQSNLQGVIRDDVEWFLCHHREYRESFSRLTIGYFYWEERKQSMFCDQWSVCLRISRLMRKNVQFVLFPYCLFERCYAVRTATCRRKVIDGEEPREGDKPLSAAARMKSSIESDRLGKRRDGMRTKWGELDVGLALNRVGLTRKRRLVRLSFLWTSKWSESTWKETYEVFAARAACSRQARTSCRQVWNRIVVEHERKSEWQRRCLLRKKYRRISDQ